MRRGTPLYGLYRYMRPQRVGFFSRFGHKEGIDYGHFAAILVINRVNRVGYFFTLVLNSFFLEVHVATSSSCKADKHCLSHWS